MDAGTLTTPTIVRGRALTSIDRPIAAGSASNNRAHVRALRNTTGAPPAWKSSGVGRDAECREIVGRYGRRDSLLGHVTDAQRRGRRPECRDGRERLRRGA